MKLKLGALPRWLRDFVPLLCLMGLIFYLSNQSRLIAIESQSGEKLFYKSAHFLVYAILAWLWWRALSPRRAIHWQVLFTALGLTILYGISDEYHQTFIPYRFGRVADVLFDTGGALAMILLLRHAQWLRDFPEELSLPFITSKPGRVEVD